MFRRTWSCFQSHSRGWYKVVASSLLSGTQFTQYGAHTRPVAVYKRMAGLGDWANFVFFITCSENFKHQVQGIYGQVHWLKKPMLAYGKRLPRNNQFSVFCPKKIKYYPENKICPNFWKIYPKKQNLPSHLVQPTIEFSGIKLKVSFTPTVSLSVTLNLH